MSQSSSGKPPAAAGFSTHRQRGACANAEGATARVKTPPGWPLGGPGCEPGPGTAQPWDPGEAAQPSGALFRFLPGRW